MGWWGQAKAMGWGGEEGEPSLPRWRENVLRSSFTESAEQRWVRATREVALHLMGLDLFFASSSLSPKLSLWWAAFVLTSPSTRGSQPSAREGTKALDSQFRVLAGCWAPAYPPGLILTPGERGRPLPAAHPGGPHGRDALGAACFQNPVRRLKFDFRDGGFWVQPSDKDPATRQTGSYPWASRRASFRKRLHFRAPRRQGGTANGLSPRAPGMPSPTLPSSLPDLAPYLEKLRDFPPGQILLGFVGVHGCSARALGRRREAPGLRRSGLGLAVSTPNTAQPSLSRGNTRSALPTQAGPPSASPWRL